MPATPSSSPQAPSPSLGRGRPRALDDSKRREICALIAGGCGLREAARYVGCSLTTIRREVARDPEFDQQLRRSEMYAQLSPLRAMQHAVATHWRAAAWMLERAFPERFSRPDPGAFRAPQARRLLNEVLDIIGSEITDPFQHERIAKRLRATFEYSLRAACDRRRTARDLRRAMAFFEQKDRLEDPLSQFGFPTPDLASLFKPKPPHAQSSPAPRPRPQTSADPDDAPVAIEDFANALREGLNQVAAKLAASADAPSAPPRSPAPDGQAPSASPAPNNP